LRGDEEVLLSGMDARFPELRVNLPGEQPVFRVNGLGRTPLVESQPYLILVDVPRRLLNVIWVGRTPLPRPLLPRQAGELALAVQVQMRRV
jgi:hypothetical protein